MGHRNNPANLARRDDDARFLNSQDSRPLGDGRPYPQASGPGSHQGFGGSDAEPRARREDEYQAEPYMAGNNTYRESDRGQYGPGYYAGGGGSRQVGAYEGSGYWDADYERAQRGNWHSDDYRHPHYGAVRYDPRHDGPRDYRAGDRPAGGYGSYGSSDGSYGDGRRSPQQYGGSQQPQQHFDPDYHQWRTEQMNKLDADYHSWRADRYKKFSDEFNSWRSSRKDDTADAASGTNRDIEGTAANKAGNEAAARK